MISRINKYRRYWNAVNPENSFGGSFSIYFKTEKTSSG